MASLLDFLGMGANALVGQRVAEQEGEAERAAMEQQTLLEALDREEKARAAEMNRRLNEAQIRNLDSLAQERGRVTQPQETFTGQPFEGVGPDGKPGLFLRGSLGTIRPVEGVHPMTENRPARTQVVGESIVNLDTGTAEPIQGLPTDGQGRVSAATRTQIAENTATLDLIGRARQAVQQRPESFGLRRGISLLPGMGQIGEVINQRTDPEGVEARQLIGNLSSRVIKDRSGAAVTVSEFPRLAAFIPMPYDTPEKILANLEALERELRVVTEALANGATLEELSSGGSGTPLPAAQPQSGAATPTPTSNVPPPPDFEAWRRTRRQP